MTKGQPDFLDLVAYPIFMLFGIVQLGWITPEIPVVGIGLNEALITLPEQTEISLALLAMLAAFTVVVVTNQWDVSGWSGVQVYVVMLTYAMIISPPLIPLMDWLLSNPLVGFVSLLVQTVGYMVVSWMG